MLNKKIFFILGALIIFATVIITWRITRSKPSTQQTPVNAQPESAAEKMSPKQEQELEQEKSEKMKISREDVIKQAKEDAKKHENELQLGGEVEVDENILKGTSCGHKLFADTIRDDGKRAIICTECGHLYVIE